MAFLRTRSNLLVLLVAALSLLPLAASGPPAGNGPPAGKGSPGQPGPIAHPHVPGEVLVKFRAGAGPGERARFRAGLGATRVREALGRRLEHLRLGAGKTVEEALERYRRHPLVEYIEPNYLVQADSLPVDPRFPEMYGLRNTGQTGGTPGADIDAELAWNITTGSTDVLVGVIDTGIDHNHPDLAANMWTNPGEIPGNGLDDDGNGFIDDVRGWDFANGDNNPFDDAGHGSHVAGTIGSVADNDLGVAGVNWKVSLVGIKFLNQFGSGTIADAIAAVEYATLIGVDLTNNSWGGSIYVLKINA